MTKLALLLALSVPAWAEPWFVSYATAERRIAVGVYAGQGWLVDPVDTLFICFPTNQSYAGKVSWDYEELGIEKTYRIPFYLEESPYGACGYWTVDPARRPLGPITVDWTTVGPLDGSKDYPKP